jgi:hypothetical protein
MVREPKIEFSKINKPVFDKNGNLPKGVHILTVGEIEKYFTWTKTRKKLMTGLKKSLDNMKKAGVQKIWIDGSFVTAKDDPNDIDGCWEAHQNIDEKILDPVFLQLNPPRAAMFKKYGVDYLISNRPFVDMKGKHSSLEKFFQMDCDGNPKGILLIML